MKKFLLGASLLLIAQMGFGQAVSDQAVIPVSVTLNSILRLTVTSGGNIQFVVTTVDHYTLGIGNAPRYTTSFRVSSSRDFTVTMATEHATHFTGLEAGTADQFLLNNVGYILTGQGVNLATIQGLNNSRVIVPTGAAGGNKPYSIAWELGTVAGGGMNAANLLTQSIPADVYVANVFLTLAPQ